MSISDEELFNCIKSFCACLLNSKRGDPPYLKCTDDDKSFLNSNAGIFPYLDEKFFEAQVYNIRRTADNEFQNHIRKTLDYSGFPYLSLSEHNSDVEICSILSEYCIKNGITFPEGFIGIARYLRKKSVDLENAKIYVDSIIKFRESVDTSTMRRLIRNNVKAIQDISETFQENINAIAEEQQKKFENVEQKLKSAEKKSTESSITILGIFAAVVLTFNAGVSFSSVVIHSFIESSIYRAVLITSLFGIILGNAILGLFAYLEFVRKSSSTIGKVSFIKSKTFIVMLVMNLISICLIVADVAYYLGWIPLQ